MNESEWFREVFSRKHQPDEAGCWIWSAYTAFGYGRVYVPVKSDMPLEFRGLKHQAHRLSYKYITGRSVRDDWQIDHLCRVTQCVNPDHLEDVPPRINCLRSTNFAAQKYRQTECIHGHAFDSANTIIRRNGTRQCRACANAHLRDLRRRRAAERAAAREQVAA